MDTGGFHMNSNMKLRPNDLHMCIQDRYMVLVQWGNPPDKDVTLLIVFSMNPEGRSIPDDGGVFRGESVSLDAVQRERVIAALRGEAPPCDCVVCCPNISNIKDEKSP
jgi:hypothetical protein